MFERVQRASGLRISTQAAGRVEGRPGYAKIAGILLYWAAQASRSHRSGGRGARPSSFYLNLYQVSLSFFYLLYTIYELEFEH